MSVQDKLSDWIQWHKLCDLDQCNPDVQERLGAYARAVFVQMTRSVLKTNNLPLDLLPDQAGSKNEDEKGLTCWAYIQNYLLTKRHNNTGKTYKYYICDYAFKQTKDAYHKTLRKGFKIQVRNVVCVYFSEDRKALKRDNSVKLLTLDQTIGETGEKTIADTLKNSDFITTSLLASLSDSEYNDFREIAEKEGSAIFCELGDREQYAIWAGINGLSLATPQLLKQVDCKKSQLYEARKNVEKIVDTHLKAHFPNETPESLYMLKVFIADKLEREIILWEKSEKLDLANFKEE